MGTKVKKTAAGSKPIRWLRGYEKEHALLSNKALEGQSFMLSQSYTTEQWEVAHNRKGQGKVRIKWEILAVVTIEDVFLWKDTGCAQAFRARHIELARRSSGDEFDGVSFSMKIDRGYFVAPHTGPLTRAGIAKALYNDDHLADFVELQPDALDLMLQEINNGHAGLFRKLEEHFENIWALNALI